MPCRTQTLLAQLADLGRRWTKPRKGATPMPAPMRSMGPSVTRSRARELAMRPRNMGTRISRSRALTPFFSA